MFKIIPDYEFAMVSEEGCIKSTHTGNTLNVHEDNDGYLRCKVWCPLERKLKGVSVHRAKAKSFIPNPLNLPCVNHLDLNRQNNDIANLEWCTVAENNAHGLLYGDIVVGKFGENNLNSNITEQQVHEVCTLLVEGLSQVDIARITGIKKSSVFDIKAKTKWIAISSLYDIPLINRKLKDSVVHNICLDLCLGISTQDLTIKYSLGAGNIMHIKNRKTFKHISILYDWDKVQRSVDKT
jgi:hypothetical protein